MTAQPARLRAVDLRFDLARFDSQAAQLDLVVDATRELELARGVPAHEITGAI